VDDTLFGSGKDGLAISEKHIYAKNASGDVKSLKIGSIQNISIESHPRGGLDIYIGNSVFTTLNIIVKEDHAFLLGILKAVQSAAQSQVRTLADKAPTVKKSKSVAGTVACTECTFNLPIGAKFCLECGAKVLPKGVCLECNAKLPEKAKFCSECGTPAGRVPATAVQPKVDTQAFIASSGSTDVPVDGGDEGAIDSSEGMVSGEVVDWRQAADRAFNFFFNAIRKGEDTDTAAEWFRGEIAEQTEAAGVVYDYGWEEEITPSQLQIISNIVANRLKGLNDEQGYQVSSDFYHGFIASFSNIIYNRSQEGNGDFENLQEYWDQTICNELPEECGTRVGPFASELTPAPIVTTVIEDSKMTIISNYTKCMFLNIATIDDSDFPTPVGVGENPIVILVSEDEDKFLGLIGEDISKSKEIFGDSFADILDGYIDHIQNEFSKFYKIDIEKSFLFEFILGLHAQDFDDFEYENEDTTFSYYDFSDDINLEDSLGKYGFLLASMDGECTYTDKSLKINGDDCASAGDCLEICMSDGNQYAAFLD
jgi:ribosomal protein L40E